MPARTANRAIPAMTTSRRTGGSSRVQPSSPAITASGEEPGQAEQPIDHHRRDGQALPLAMLAGQVGRLDEVAPHRAGEHHVEEDADEAQSHRLGHPEREAERHDQEMPAHERQEDAREEETEAEAVAGRIDPTTEDRAEVLAMRPEDDPE